MLINIKEHKNAKQLHPSLVLEYPTIKDLIKEINQIGIRRVFTAKCLKCEHEWENEIDFNPVNFS